MGETRAWKFPVGVDTLTGKILTVGLAEDVRQSIVMLLETIKGERLKRPEYGSYLNRFMFEPVNFTLANEVRAEIKNVIAESEPRVDRLEVLAAQSNENAGALIIRIKYVCKETGEANEILYEFDSNT